MFTLDGIRVFHKWTHASLDVTLHHLALMPACDFVREVPGFGFASLRDQALHIFNCEGFWLHMLRERPYKDQTSQECRDLADIRNLQKATRANTEELLGKLTDSQLNSEVALRLPDGNSLIRTPAHVFHHVMTHAFHHKGQIVAMCRLLGYPATDTDMI